MVEGIEEDVYLDLGLELVELVIRGVNCVWGKKCVFALFLW